MNARVMIVEDEILVAANLEATIEDLGYEPIGIAPDMEAAMSLACARPDLALVDLNLRDGETGALIGARLGREHGVAVLFLTANPRSLGAGVPGTLGVVAKPYDEGVISEIIDFALKRKRGARATAPAYLTEFNLPIGQAGPSTSPC
jgi:DNA-binding response OmpR family regulator